MPRLVPQLQERQPIPRRLIVADSDGYRPSSSVGAITPAPEADSEAGRLRFARSTATVSSCTATNRSSEVVPMAGEGVEVPCRRFAPSRPIPIDLFREWSVAPRSVLPWKAPWWLGAIIPPLIGWRSGGADSKAPACHSPSPGVP